METPYFAVIMAGGGGTRLWPLSRRKRPKQILPLFNGRSLFREAVDRLDPLFSSESILVVTSAALLPALEKEAPRVPRANYLCEPDPRSTAPAIALAVAEIEHRCGSAVMACLTADHYIVQEERFRAALAAAGEVAQKGFLVTLGIDPTCPETGYGYIERGDLLDRLAGFDVHRVTAFREKPSAELAQGYLADGRHSWNSGMFIWKTEDIEAEFQRQLPVVGKALEEIRSALGTRRARQVTERVWAHLPNQSLDYGILEGAKRVAVIPVHGLGWTDVGSWDSLLDLYASHPELRRPERRLHLDQDSNGLVVLGEARDGRLLATVGLKDLIVVEAEDALLVCARGASQAVRQIVERLNDLPAGSKWQ
jgi:mannose-1-phosphate guanylyltransferase